MEGCFADYEMRCMDLSVFELSLLQTGAAKRARADVLLTCE